MTKVQSVWAVWDVPQVGQEYPIVFALAEGYSYGMSIAAQLYWFLSNGVKPSDLEPGLATAIAAVDHPPVPATDLTPAWVAGQRHTIRELALWLSARRSQKTPLTLSWITTRWIDGFRAWTRRIES